MLLKHHPIKKWRFFQFYVPILFMITNKKMKLFNFTIYNARLLSRCPRSSAG